MLLTSIWKSPSRSAVGAGTRSTIVLRRGSMESPPAATCARSSTNHPFLAVPYTTGDSNCSSVAPSSRRSSRTFSCTPSGSEWSRSTLLITITGLSPFSRALRSTKRVWACGPSYASTTRRTPSTIFITRSTSAPKSACPGVSTMLRV